MNTEQLDWGPATPEMYDGTNRVACHVINANLVGDENTNRVLKFVCARILHFDSHLPDGSSQHVRFDLRGQMIGNKKLDSVRKAVVDESRGRGIQVAVDFLTS